MTGARFTAQRNPDIQLRQPAIAPATLRIVRELEVRAAGFLVFSNSTRGRRLTTKQAENLAADRPGRQPEAGCWRRTGLSVRTRRSIHTPAFRHILPYIPYTSNLSDAGRRVQHRKQNTLSIQSDLSLARKGRTLLGSTRIGLLEAIDKKGSITHAAKHVGLSYKGAWDAIDAMNNLSEQPLVLRATGGQHGGGSHLTEHGRAAVRLYRTLEAVQQKLLANLQDNIDDFDRLNELLRTIAMKTSARNQLRGIVKTVRKGAVNADVVLDLGDGVEIFANITKEAVEDLGLKRGRAAVALIKSSFVLLTTDMQLRVSARNRLPGVVTEVTPGAVNAEVRLQLPGGRTLVAIVTNDARKELKLAADTPCCALIKASHVLIAVND